MVCQSGNGTRSSSLWTKGEIPTACITWFQSCSGLLLLIDLCDRTTIFQSQPRLPKPNQRLPLRLLFLQRLPLRLLLPQRLALRLLFLQRVALRLLLLLRLALRLLPLARLLFLGFELAQAILWLRACSFCVITISKGYHWQFICPIDRIGSLFAFATQ